MISRVMRVAESKCHPQASRASTHLNDLSTYQILGRVDTLATTEFRIVADEMPITAVEFVLSSSSSSLSALIISKGCVVDRRISTLLAWNALNLGFINIIRAFSLPLFPAGNAKAVLAWCFRFSWNSSLFKLCCPELLVFKDSLLSDHCPVGLLFRPRNPQFSNPLIFVPCSVTPVQFETTYLTRSAISSIFDIQCSSILAFR
ncbi:hypothetical protein FB451DRAFT_298896 [Mycena latifolia]|nr:hypothetical protein FB451DRAFT_298896 [Mycena latifolia]